MVQNSIGSNGTVKTLGQMETVEIRYIGAETQTSDVEKDLRDMFTELDGVTFETKMTKSFNGMQTASVKLPTKLATLVAARGKIRIGWSICPVKIQIPNRRCFKCWETGHFSRDCKGPDRTDCCLQCGETGHFAKTCVKPPRCVLCPPGTNMHHTSGVFFPASKQKSTWR